MILIRNCLYFQSKGRDPLRSLPTHSPSPNRKVLGYKPNSPWIPEDLNEEQIYKKLNERRPSKEMPQIPGKNRTASTDEEVMAKMQGSPRPGLRKRPFSVAVGVADMFKENKEIVKNVSEIKRSQSPVIPPSSSPELNKQRPKGDGDASPPPDNRNDVESFDTERKESRVRKISSHSGGRRSPNKTKYVAVASFVAEESGEVSLEDGEEVEVLQKEASGWWYVKNDLRDGWVPSAYLEEAQSSRSPSPETLNQPQNAADSQDQFIQMEKKSDSLTRGASEREVEKRAYMQEKQKVGISTSSQLYYLWANLAVLLHLEHSRHV